jgi:hypothetical protein
MRFHLKNLITMGLPVFVSVMLLAATATFGQEPARPHDAAAPHHEQVVQPSNSVHRPFVQAGELVDQLKKLGAAQKSRWEELLRVLKLAVNLLSGNETNLLSGNRPELLSKNKAALLSGNSPNLLSGNSPKLLSGNKPEILSHNKTSLFSGNHISLFSGLKIEIHIENTGNNSGNHAPPPPPHETPVKPIVSP